MLIPPPPASDPPPGDAKPITVDTDSELQKTAGYVLDCLNQGSKPAEIRKSLVAKGLSHAAAKAVVNQVLRRWHDYTDVKAVQARGRRNIVIGGLVCVIGLLVTLVTFAPVGPQSGFVVIAWGAVLWGGIQFFRGIWQWNQTGG